MALNEGACPSRFPWRTSPRKRPQPTVRTMSTTRTKMQGLEESLSEDKEIDEELLVHFVDLVIRQSKRWKNRDRIRMNHC